MLCDAAADLPCWDPETECECGPADTPPGCRPAIRDLFQCMVSELPDSLTCDGGDITIRCGVCEDALASVPPDCGFDVGDCAP